MFVKDKQLKVLMLGPSLESKGGMATVEKQYCDGLKKHGVKVDFISTYVDSNKLVKLIVAAGALCKCYKTILNYDILHVHMASRGSFERKKHFIQIAKKRNIKTIVHLHGGEFAKWFETEVNSEKRREIRSVLNDVSALIVLSSEWEDWFVRNGFRSDSIHVIENGVVPPESMADPKNSHRVLFMGTMNENKSPDALIKAAAPLILDGAELELVFAGSGNTVKYERLASHLGIRDNCTFLGWISGSEIEEQYLAASIYCLPSKNEGMPMSILEAMSYGLPIISTPVGGIPQLVAEGENGYLVKAGDQGKLTDRLEELLSNADLRETMGRKSRAIVESRFSLPNNLKMVKSLYDNLMNE